jgi:hypothetical protein
MNEAVVSLLAKRRDKAIAVILSTKELHCDEFLPDSESSVLRKVVLDQINDYYDLCFDIIKSLDNDSVVLNNDYLDKIDEIYNKVTT